MTEYKFYCQTGNSFRKFISQTMAINHAMIDAAVIPQDDVRMSTRRQPSSDSTTSLPPATVSHPPPLLVLPPKWKCDRHSNQSQTSHYTISWRSTRTRTSSSRWRVGGISIVSINLIFLPNLLLLLLWLLFFFIASPCRVVLGESRMD